MMFRERRPTGRRKDPPVKVGASEMFYDFMILRLYEFMTFALWGNFSYPPRPLYIRVLAIWRETHGIVYRRHVSLRGIHKLTRADDSSRTTNDRRKMTDARKSGQGKRFTILLIYEFTTLACDGVSLLLKYNLYPRRDLI